MRQLVKGIIKYSNNQSNDNLSSKLAEILESNSREHKEGLFKGIQTISSKHLNSSN